MCGRHHVSIYSLNAVLLIKEKICGGGFKGDDCKDEENVAAITSCAFYEGVRNEWLVRDLFFTGRSDGKVDVSENHPYPIFCNNSKKLGN